MLAQLSGAGHHQEILFCIFSGFHHLSVGLAKGVSAESRLIVTYHTAFCGSGSDQTCLGSPHPFRVGLAFAGLGFQRTIHFLSTVTSSNLCC